MIEDIDTPSEAAQNARQSAEGRRKSQDRQDPSGHGMQVTPRQQQQITESSGHPAATAEINQDALDELKGDDDTS